MAKIRGGRGGGYSGKQAMYFGVTEARSADKRLRKKKSYDISGFFN